MISLKLITLCKICTYTMLYMTFNYMYTSKGNNLAHTYMHYEVKVKSYSTCE